MLGVCISRTKGFLQRISGGTKLSAGSCACLVKRARSMAYSIGERGSAYSMDYQVYFKKDEQYVSPFHDIPLYDDVRSKEEPVLNMVVEVPRWTNAKMEISRTETLNPIKQDVKKEKPRFVNNCFPYNGYIWNYGAFPQTWEDPTHTEPSTGAKGDNDPLDVLEIGGRVARRGEVLKVKVLGTMALIDEGETDWKILTIDVNDPLAEKLNDVCDIEKYMPGLLQATKEWFRIYKIPTGKPPNQFAFDGQAKDKEFAMKVVRETNQQWKALLSKSCDPGTINCANTTLTWSPYVISQEQACAVVQATPPPTPPHPIPTEVDKWYFFRDDKVVN